MDTTDSMEGMKPAPKPYKTCGAKNRQGRPCAKPPLRGRERCRNHGGASPVGMAHPNFKTGRWSRYLPKNLKAKYEEAQADPFAKTHTSDLALIDAKVKDLLERADNEGNPVWLEIWPLIELRRRVLESEYKHLKDQQQMISIEELMVLTRFIGDSIKTAVLKHVDDESGKRLIADVCRDLTLCMSRYAAPRFQHSDLESPNLLA